MTAESASAPALGIGRPYAREIDAERRGWYDVEQLVRSLMPEVCLQPGSELLALRTGVTP
jgi:hypothetical protein